MTYDMTIQDLIREFTLTQWGYADNEYMDGYRDEMPDIEHFVDELYEYVVNRHACEIILDGGVAIDYIFPDETRFLGTEGIKNIIHEAIREY